MGKAQRAQSKLFMGRHHECASLDQAWQATVSGRLQIVLLSGELGIGKSTLWQRWSAGLPPETIVLDTRCLDTTQALPFAPLAGLFGTQYCLARIADPETSISQVWLTELARLLPEIRDYYPELPLVSSLPAPEERRRLFEAFVQLLRGLAAGPLVLFVDDLHWADQATLDWLVYLADRMHAEPLLLVGAYRLNEGPPELLEQVAQWKRTHGAQQLLLSQFTLDEATELLMAMENLEDNGALLDYFYTQSGGNPYYLTELARVHPDGTPAALVDLLNARLRSLPERTQRVLQAASILEPQIRFETVHHLVKLSEDEVLDALDHLLDAVILIERGHEYEFAHPLLATIVRDGLSVARRRQLHKRAAQELMAIHRDNWAPIAGQLTAHFAATGEAAEAARHADLAADHAFQMAAMAEAVAFYRQAYALESTPIRRLALGNALMQLPGYAQEARAAMEQALIEFETRQDPAGIVLAGLHLSVSYLAVGEGAKVLYWAERLATDLGDIADVKLRATVEYLLAQGKFHTAHDITEAAPHFYNATRLATEHNLASDIALQSWFGWGNLAIQCGEFVQAQTKFQQALAQACATGNIYFEALCYNNLSYAALLASDLATARSTMERGLDFVNHHELLRPRQYLYSTRGEIALTEGHLDEATLWFERGIDEAERYENAPHVINIRANLGRVALARGDVAQAEELLTVARRAIASEGTQHLQLQVDLWLAELYLNCNDKVTAEVTLHTMQKQLVGSQRKGIQTKVDQLMTDLSSSLP